MKPFRIFVYIYHPFVKHIFTVLMKYHPSSANNMSPGWFRQKSRKSNTPYWFIVLFPLTVRSFSWTEGTEENITEPWRSWASFQDFQSLMQYSCSCFFAELFVPTCISRKSLLSVDLINLVLSCLWSLGLSDDTLHESKSLVSIISFSFSKWWVANYCNSFFVAL